MKQKLLLFLAGIAFVGCVEKGMFSNVHIEANTSLPMGKIFFSDSSLFAMAGDFSSQLKVGANHVLGVALVDSLVLADEAKFNELFQIPAQNIAFRIDLTSFPNLSSQSNRAISVPIPRGAQHKVSLNMGGGERLDSVIFKTGEIGLNVAGMQGADIDITIVELKNKRTNAPLTFKAGTSVFIDDSYALTPNNKNGASNEITIKFSGSISPATSLSCNFNMFLTGLQYAKGYFGRKKIHAPTITLSTTSEFQDFANMVDYIYFTAPSLDFKILNQYDAPMLLTIDTLEISGVKLKLKPSKNLFFVGAKSTASLSLSNENTVNGDELSRLINKNFKSFKINLNAIMNPDASDVAGVTTGYVQPTSNSFSVTDSLFGTYAVAIPMDGVIENIHFEQGLSIDLSGLKSDQTKVQEFAFAFSGKNYMPLDIKINAFVRQNDNENGAKIMLFKNPIVIPASQTINVIDATPYTIDASNRQIVDIKAEVIDAMLTSKKVYLELTTSTKDAAQKTNVKIFSPSSIDLKVQVGAKVDLMVGGN